MGETERGLIMELGGALQLLDDYQDVALDRLSGICTKATRASIELSDVIARLKLAGGNLVEYYGRMRAAPESISAERARHPWRQPRADRPPAEACRC